MITPVVLSGGTGTRLWPLSRQSYPKQLLPLAGDRTMLQEAVLRARSPDLFAPPIVIANAEHRFVIAEQLREIGVVNGRIVLEPFGRNTAAAVAVAAILATNTDPDAIMLVMPSDHVIKDRPAFEQAIAMAAEAARSGDFVLFGIHPDRPETGYGYIQPGHTTGTTGVRHVDAFVEKPDLAAAERYLTEGYLWNSGIFLLPATGVIEALERHEPDVFDAAHRAVAASAADLDFMRLDESAFASAPSISIDRAVMERTDRAAVLPVDIGWSDAGTWSGLWALAERDAVGNVLIGDVVAVDTANSYVRSEGPLVTTLGVTDLVVVATADAVLVASRTADQKVSDLVALLKGNGTEAATQSPWVHRPWGYYQSVHAGDRFQVKRITVNPGARLSLQRHKHRAEHWVVVNGTALVTRDHDRITVNENESIFLPQGCVHRLENATDAPLNLIEVQSGSYLGEDDIERIEDDFARVETESSVED